MSVAVTLVKIKPSHQSEIIRWLFKKIDSVGFSTKIELNKQKIVAYESNEKLFKQPYYNQRPSWSCVVLRCFHHSGSSDFTGCSSWLIFLLIIVTVLALISF